MMSSIHLLIDCISLDMSVEEVDEILDFLDDKDLRNWPVVLDMKDKLHDLRHKTATTIKLGPDPSLSVKIAEVAGGKPL